MGRGRTERQLVMRPSSIAPNPVQFREAPPNSTVTLTSQFSGRNVKDRAESKPRPEAATGPGALITVGKPPAARSGKSPMLILLDLR